MESIASSRKIGFWKSLTGYLSLFTSVGTLICCALPATMVSLGLGATFASMSAAVPQLLVVSEYKGFLFLSAFVFLTLGFLLERREISCPADRALGKACARTRVINAVVLRVSSVLLAIGFFFAYLAPALL
jgi:hypothetical protein